MRAFHLEHVWNTESGQDGAIYGDYLFRLDARGVGHVYSVSKGQMIGDFLLGDLDKVIPHSNSVSFGTEFYEAGDPFPLLYTNVYNNYAKAEDRLEGVCCVYRITVDEDLQGEKPDQRRSFSVRLVQLIRIGFVEDLDRWKSLPGQRDVRPYGNFVVDTDGQRLWAFTMRDREQVTRYFQFSLPGSREGEFHETYQVPVVTLQTSEIERQFDCAYTNYMQGACCHGGRIYSVEGFSGAVHPARMQVIDLERGEQCGDVDLYGMGLSNEPELVDFCGDTLYYSNAQGNVYQVLWEE